MPAIPHRRPPVVPIRARIEAWITGHEHNALAERAAREGRTLAGHVKYLVRRDLQEAGIATAPSARSR